jgi:RHS repeat-associated protein
VFFDDLNITHTKGKVLQEDHYYPFGMNINALSSSAPLSKPNKLKYHGQELQEEFDLGWYQFKWRNHDPAIARFFNIDPLSEKYVYNSPYAFAENKLGLGFELEGLEMEQFNGRLLQMRMTMSPQDRKQLDRAMGGWQKR